MNPALKEALRALLPTRIRAHRIRRGLIRGARIYTSWHDYPGAILGTTEGPLLAWFARHVKPGETWLDIGAHYGYTSIALSRLVGTSGRVFAFEPVLATAGCIVQTREANRLTQLRIAPVALSADPAIRPHRLPVVRGMADSVDAGSTHRQVVFAVSLDPLWKCLSEGNPMVHGVKIDVQGMEIDVLSGMRDLLRRWRPKLVVEFHHGVDRWNLVNIIESCGYGHSPIPVTDMRLPAAPAQFEDNRSYAFFPSAEIA